MGSRTVTVVLVSIVEVDVMVCVIVVRFPLFVDAVDEKERAGPITQVVSNVVTTATDVGVAFS